MATMKRILSAFIVLFVLATASLAATEALQIDALWSGLNNPSTGKSYSGAIVATFAADGSTAKAIWEDKEKTLPSALGKAQFTLDSNGQAEVFGDGVYVIKVYDSTDTGLSSPIMTFDGLSYIISVDPSNEGYDSIADMRAGTGGADDGYLKYILGYYTPDDGGEGWFYWDASSVLSDNGITIIKVTSVLTGRWIRSYSNEVYVDWAGPDGTADDVEIQAAGDLVPDGGYLVFTDGKTYTCTSALIWTDQNISFRGEGILDFSGLAASETCMTVTGSLSGTSTTATAAIDKKDISITVASISGFDNTKMLRVTSTEFATDADPDFQYLKGELSLLESSTGSALTLSAGARDDYSITGETVTISEVDQISNITVDGLTIIGAGLGNSQLGITVTYAENVLIKNIKMEEVEDDGIALVFVYNGTINKCSVIGANGGDGSAPAYAYDFTGPSVGCSVINSYARDFRHAWTSGGLYPTWEWTIKGNHFEHSYGNSSAIATHSNSTKGEISENYIHDTYIGISTLGTDTIIDNNTISNTIFASIYAISQGMVNLSVTNNTMYSPVGITIEPYTIIGGGPALYESSGIVTGNKLYAEATAGSTIAAGINCQADNFHVDNNLVDGYSPGITFRGNNTEITSNKVYDVSDGNLPYGIYALSVLGMEGSIIKGNRIYNTITPEITYPFYVSTLITDLIITDNYVDDDYVTDLIFDSGTRTLLKNNYIGDEKQTYIIWGPTAGIAEATTAGYVKTTVDIRYEVNGRTVPKSATDDLWDFTGISTGVGEFKSVLCCLDVNGVASTVEGVVGVGYSTANVPKYWPYDVTPIGLVILPASYSGGALTGGTFVLVDVTGQIN